MASPEYENATGEVALITSVQELEWLQSKVRVRIEQLKRTP